ncbi:aminoacyl-tRNA hydrolase [Hoeflea prorocentri]|uniref:peptidyl-tRNA hydrolase n=1 Tax=Hoeflea prorocentri TaxID=1922333 RepID=A0A9X3UI51_9HYPH|nr:aminoacyl-tRNA hydrolase [Hoeflea prorocentri]MCY6381099.1 aminoacyl-tRNA hydrolase [Hoeflea prorocentri]MDA5398899.1 aminoacyl-tRNA hydrolase [Hoeflea prorocentri]
MPQVAHAFVAALLVAALPDRQARIEQAIPKIVLATPSTEILEELLSLATARGLPAELVRDSGRTVLTPGTTTCLGLGPAKEQDIDRLTSRLTLY